MHIASLETKTIAVLLRYLLYVIHVSRSSQKQLTLMDVYVEIALLMAPWRMTLSGSTFI